jgi:hypothetical protein
MNRWNLRLLGWCAANRHVFIVAIHNKEVGYEAHTPYVAVEVITCASGFVSSEKLSKC